MRIRAEIHFAATHPRDDFVERHFPDRQPAGSSVIGNWQPEFFSLKDDGNLTVGQDVVVVDEALDTFIKRFKEI